MLTGLVSAAVKGRWFVLALTVAFMVLGGFIVANIPVDAFPDLTNLQVVVSTEAPRMPPAEVDQLVTFPIASSLMGLPKLQVIRSMSKLGLSMITVVFDDSVNLYFARQLVNERLQQAQSRLPANMQPTLGPVATAFGEVYQYTVDGPSSLMDRKTLHDWQIRYDLRSTPGVSEVNSWGGETKQYTIEPKPAEMQKYGLTLHDLVARVQANNANFGGGFIDYASEQYTVLGLGRVRGLEDIGSTVVLANAGISVLLRDVAEVKIDHLPRQGAVSRNGKGETVAGMVIQLKGENGRDVIQRVKQEIGSLTLPKGVALHPFYDQSQVIDATIHTVRKNLLEAGVLVITILLLFLGNLRAAVIVAMVIPLAMLFGFAGMALFGVSANLMSLGAIDFGMIVDGAVVMMENSVRRLSEGGENDPKRTLQEAGHEVSRPILFGVMIIIAVYLPIFFLQDLEGRMFRPMAITVCSALVGSLLLALTFVPAMGSILLRNVKEGNARWFERVQRGYERSLDRVLAHRKPAAAIALVIIAVALGSLKAIGTEFMPRLDEGSLLITTKKLPGISLPESLEISRRIERTVLTFPEVTSVTTKMGRPDLATEAMGVYEADVYVNLKPREQWTTAGNRPDLASAMAKKLEKIPGVAYNFTQPMAMRLDETVSGIKADVAVKIFGEDSKTLKDLSERALKVLESTPGSADAQAEVITGVPELHVLPDRAALARYSLNLSDIQEAVEIATGGLQTSELIDEQRRFPIAFRLPEASRVDMTAIGNLQLHAPGGELPRLNQVAQLITARGPEMLNREDAKRLIVVQSNVRGTDLGSFVKDAQQRMNSQLKLPAGYSIRWGGQFENQARATKRLTLVLPLSLAIIFMLLYLTFQSFGETFLILLAVPFALAGGVGALWLRGLNLSLSASIGFIALFGVAVLNGIVMVSYINQLRSGGEPVERAVRRGASLRLRPVLMTALVASLGFIPMALSTSQGSEVQRPLATVVIGGLFTATLLTLYLLPVAYPWFAPERLNVAEEEEAAVPVER